MRTASSSFGQRLFGKVRGRILALLYGTTDNACFARQIARETDTSIGAVQRELQMLTKDGFILRTKLGNQIFYRANTEHPLFNDLRNLIAKTFGIPPVLTEALEPVRVRIEFAFLYGSFARSQETAQSDIDLMIVGEVSLDEVLEHLTPLEGSIRRQINPSVYSPEELRTKLHAGHHFLTSVQQGKTLFLIGNEHDFREIR